MNLVEIIKVCGQNAVTRLEYDGIVIDFAPVHKTFIAEKPILGYNEEYAENPEDEIVSKYDIDLEELKLSDPLGYEEYLIEGSQS